MSVTMYVQIGNALVEDGVKMSQIVPCTLHAHGRVSKGEDMVSPAENWTPIGSPDGILDLVVTADFADTAPATARRQAIVVYSNIAVSLCGAELNEEKKEFYEWKRMLYYRLKDLANDDDLPDLTPFDILLSSFEDTSL